MAKGWSVVAAVSLCMIGSIASADEMVSLKVGYQILSPSGELAGDAGGAGTRVDLEQDLDLDNSKGLTAEAAFALGDYKLTVGYLPLSYEGRSVLSRSIVFNDQDYTAGSTIASSLDLDIVDVGLTWFFINMDDTPTRLQLGLEVTTKLTEAETSLVDQTSGMSESVSGTIPFPTIGLRGHVALADFFGINGRFGYLGYGDNQFVDGDIQVEFSPVPLVGIFAGYRYLDIQIDESDIYVDADFSGFYGGAMIRF